MTLYDQIKMDELEHASAV